MGVMICNSYVEPEVGELEPMVATFSRAPGRVRLSAEHSALFERMKQRLEVIDCRGEELQWFESPKYNLYLYGSVVRDRPLGNCLFYVRNPALPATPILIATHVDDHYVYARNTLILYPDNVLYHGSIRNNISSLPRADGQGLLLSPDFLYRGEFKNGYPHGYGSYRSKHLEYVGVFKNGEPFGEGIEKTPSRLFIGSIAENGQRTGWLIDKHNQKTPLDRQNNELLDSKLSLRSHLHE